VAPKKSKGQKGEVSPYLNALKRLPIMSREEEIALARRIRANGPDAEECRNLFMQRNMRLVIQIAGRYVSHDRHISDLVQEGSLGLMRAVERFDPERGVKFSTYATWWIRQAIIRSIHNNNALIGIPSFVMTAKYQVEDLERHLGRPPTLDEQREYTHQSKELLKYMRNLPVAANILDSPIAAGGDSEVLVIDGIVHPNDNPDSTFVEDKIQREQVAKQIEQILRELPTRDRSILFSWASGDYKSLDIISKQTKITRERVRQIVAKALRLLKKHLKEV
jgi:RNA polymerase sigma factor (sigma-70 family)